MLFNSISFLLFFPLVLVVYYLLPKVVWRNWFLLIASYWFYMNIDTWCALILLGSTTITYLGGLLLETCSENAAKKRQVLYGIVLSNVFILALFKYANFILGSIPMGGG